MQYTQSRLLPRFTEKGFDIIQIPSSVYQKLRTIVLDQIENHWDEIGSEIQINAVYTQIPSKFVNLKGLDWKVLEELKELHEEWTGYYHIYVYIFMICIL